MYSKTMFQTHRAGRHPIYEQTVKLDFNDVLIQPQLSELDSRSKACINSKRLKTLMHIDTSGIIAANMDGVGTIEVARELKKFGALTALHKHYDLEDLLEFFETEDSSHSFYSLGMSSPDFHKLKLFKSRLSRATDVPLKICIDVANGYMTKFSDYCADVRELFPDSIIMAGNVVDIAGVTNIIGIDDKEPTVKFRNSVDIVKMGIGQGSNCLTRTQTGIGYPQLSCVLDTVHQFKSVGFNFFKGKTHTYICSDGGCVTPGDISKALVAGADTVMLGGMLAGSDEGGGDVIEVNGRKMVEFYGMSSSTAQKKHNGGLKEYRASEGRTTLVPYKGKISEIMSEINGCIRSTCTYVGALNIDELREKGTLIRVQSTHNRWMESRTVGM